MRPHIVFAWALAAAALAGCGNPGAPLPPSLNLPQPVADLQAVRKGDRVTLTWTVPTETTDEAGIRGPVSTIVCRVLDQPAMRNCEQPLRIEIETTQRGTESVAYAVDELTAEARQNPLGLASYAVEVRNAAGRSAGISNVVQVPVAPNAPAPQDVTAESVAEGVALRWSPAALPPPLRSGYRIYRRSADAPRATLLGEVFPSGRVEFLDREIEWGAAYTYVVTPLTRLSETPRVEIEGEDAPAVQITARDTFPPAAPTGLQAVFTPGANGAAGSIDLTWIPGTEADLAGFIVYRREGDAGEFARLTAQPVRTPSFRDSAVAPGATYHYSVSAVDLRNNESPQSEAARETVR